MDTSRITSEMINGVGYYSCIPEPGDTIEAICLYFGRTDWFQIFELDVNQAFRDAHSELTPDDMTPSADAFPEVGGSAGARFYIPAQSGRSGTSSTVFVNPVETFCRQIEALEQTESDPTKLTTYIRKMFLTYDSTGWDVIIPGARDIDIPSSMRQSVPARYIASHQLLPVDGRMVDIGHFFTGLDARNHPERPCLLGPSIRDIEERLGIRINIEEVQRRLGRDMNITQDTRAPVLQVTDNQRVATWSPDIGSAIVEFLHNTLGRNHSWTDYYDQWASKSDMRGNVDSYVFPFSTTQRLSQQFRSYYISPSSQRRQRFVRFRQILNMSNTDAWKRPVRVDVFNSALGYAAFQSYARMDVAYIFANRALTGITRRAVETALGVNLETWERAYRSACEVFVNRFVDFMMNTTF